MTSNRIYFKLVNSSNDNMKNYIVYTFFKSTLLDTKKEEILKDHKSKLSKQLVERRSFTCVQMTSPNFLQKVIK